MIPTSWNQTVNLYWKDLPTMSNQLHQWVLSLPENYPEYGLRNDWIPFLMVYVKNLSASSGESAIIVIP